MKLIRDKKALRLMALEFLIVSGLFTILAAVCGIIAYFNGDYGYASGILYVVIPILSLIALIFFLAFLRYFFIYKRVSKAGTVNNAEWTAECTKVRFISYPVGRTFWNIYGAILYLKAGGRTEKFIFIFPEKVSDSNRKAIKSLLLNEVHVQSYDKSNVLYDIKELVMKNGVFIDKKIT